MATATARATNHLIHDPFSGHHAHYSPSETTALLELLATDRLVDSRAPLPVERELLNDLLAVDTEFARADARNLTDVATAPALRDERDLFLDLLGTDREVDIAKGSTSPSSPNSPSRALHDPHAEKRYAGMDQFTGVNGVYAVGEGSKDQQLRDNVVMMHLLAVDESVDDSKRYNKLIQSDDYAIIWDLCQVDREVGGAKRRALILEDLQGLLDVDHLVDGVKSKRVGGTQNGKNVKNQKGDGGQNGGNGAKRSIFSVKEKYSAKVANKYST